MPDKEAVGSEAAAVRALHRRRSSFSKEQCRKALEQGLVLVEVATQTYDRRKELLTTTWQTPEAGEAADIVCAEIQDCCPDFSASTYRAALSWVFRWYYL